jgi:hypothetical protein
VAKRQTFNVTPMKFIEAYETSETYAEVAAKLGIPLRIVHARVSNYRRAGVKLKQMGKRSNKVDVETLNKRIEELGHSGVSE